MKVISLLLFCMFPCLAFGQEAPGLSRDWLSTEIVLSAAILVFAVFLVIAEAWIITRAKKSWAPQSIMRLIGLTLIICVAALLVVAGYDQDQIAPVMGLLGVIAGYLLGANNSNPTN